MTGPAPGDSASPAGSVGSGDGCAPWRVLASARLDDELTGSERRSLDEHLGRCDRCRTHVGRLDELHRRVRVAPAEPVPDLSASILGRVKERSQARARWRSGRWAVAAGVAALLAGVVVWSPGDATPEPMSTPVVLDAYAPESSRIAAVYLTISNAGGRDRLVGASTGVAERVTLHRTERRDGLVRMVPVEGFDLEGDSTLVLEPTSAHLMVEQLAGDLHAGESLDVRLRFERAGEVRTVVRVVDLDELVRRVESGPATPEA